MIRQDLTDETESTAIAQSENGAESAAPVSVGWTRAVTVEPVEQAPAPAPVDPPYSSVEVPPANPDDLNVQLIAQPPQALYPLDVRPSIIDRPAPIAIIQDSGIVAPAAVDRPADASPSHATEAPSIPAKRVVAPAGNIALRSTDVVDGARLPRTTAKISRATTATDNPASAATVGTDARIADATLAPARMSPTVRYALIAAGALAFVIAVVVVASSGSTRAPAPAPVAP